MEQGKTLCSCHLAEFDAHDVAGMSPVGFDRYRIGERVHRIENDEVGVAEELDESLGIHDVLELVFRVGRVDEALACAIEAIAVGVAAVQLQLRSDGDSRHLCRLSRRKPHELDVRRELVEGNRKAGRGLLQAEGLLEDLVAAVNPDAHAWHVGGPEKREAHDMVPMHVRHEHIHGRRPAGVAGQDVLAERPCAAAHVAHEIFVASGLELHAGGVSAVGAANREGQVLLDELVRFRHGIELPAIAGHQGLHQPVPQVPPGQRDRNRAACTPEPDPHVRPDRRPERIPATATRALRAPSETRPE